jgi:tetrahydromethanopterin S-methyltransferase subunit H
MRQLHVEHSHLRHRFECFEHCCEPVDCESVVVAFNLLRRSAETQLDQLLQAAQLLDSFVGDMAVHCVTHYVLIRTFVNDLELQTPMQRLSSESQCSTVNVVSVGSVANLFPTSVHSFERQLTKEIELAVGDVATKSEVATVWSRNSTVGPETVGTEN